MKKTILLFTLLTSSFLFLNCSVQKRTVKDNDSISGYKYLALGDSYTIGESVCDTCRFPEQLKKELNQSLNKQGDLKIIAKTGWTTTDLLKAIAQQKPASDYDLVTLLIGVNNQYQGQPFSTYEKEFPVLLEKAIQFAGGNKDHVIVVSIPDYAFTPFGQTKSDPSKISEKLAQYDAYAKKISEKKGVDFIDITPIIKKGLENKTLVASDGLHPSKEAYSQFVKLLSVKAVEILK